jgi:hypothetical protein
VTFHNKNCGMASQSELLKHFSLQIDEDETPEIPLDEPAEGDAPETEDDEEDDDDDWGSEQ